MAIVKWILVVLLALYVFSEAFLGAALTSSLANATLPQGLGPEERAYFLWHGWPQIAVIWIAVAAYVAAIGLLIAGRALALWPLLAAVLLDIGLFLWSSFAGPVLFNPMMDGLVWLFLLAMIASTAALAYQKQLV